MWVSGARCRVFRMNRQSKHSLARSGIVAKLKDLGLTVEEVSRNQGYDLQVNRFIRVALRVAFPGRYAHTVTVGGKRYQYNYRSWSFNFHRHGHWDRKYCDVFICIAKRRGEEDEIFIIPAAAVSGPTFSLHGAGNRPYRGRYAQYRDRWHLFSDSEFLEAQQQTAVA